MLVSLIVEGFATLFSWPRGPVGELSETEEDIIRRERSVIEDLGGYGSETFASELSLMALMSRDRG